MTEPIDFFARQATADVLATNLPTLHLEDVSGIPFVDGVSGVEQYQHRARVRAHEGDLFASTTPSAPGYEDYSREMLGMGQVRAILAEPVLNFPTRVARACMSGSAFDALCETARDAGGLIVHPYMGVEDVWELASRIEARADAPCYVLAPTPEALWIANDKARLTEIARELDLDDVLAETHIHTDAAGLARSLEEFATRHDRVALKRTRCASAMGNRVFDSKVLRGHTHAELVALVEDFLAQTEWKGDEDVLVVEWIDATSSPSSQLWVPARADVDQDVRVDGLYEQLLIGDQGMFLGSQPSTLPDAVEAQMRDISIKICEAFRARGYLGRCSFDFVIDRQDRARLTECNGRWGGTSSPMYLVDRLVEGVRPAYIAQDLEHEGLVGKRFPEVLELVGAELFDVSTQRGRFIFYNVGPLTGKGKLDVISLGKDPADAARGVQEVLPALLGLT